MHEERFGALAVLWAHPGGAGRASNHHRHCKRAAMHVAPHSGFKHDFVGGGEQEVGELQFNYRSQARDGSADSGADDRIF